jgi:putative transposase
MKTQNMDYCGYRFPPEIISYAVWLYHRFSLSFRDIEEVLAERGVTVSHEAIRLWCLLFGQAFAKRLRGRPGRLGDTWHLDEMFVTRHGARHYLWRAVDQDGEVLDILVQNRRDKHAAKRFFRTLLKGLQYLPHMLVTDTLAIYGGNRTSVHKVSQIV